MYYKFNVIICIDHGGTENWKDTFGSLKSQTVHKENIRIILFSSKKYELIYEITDLVKGCQNSGIYVDWRRESGGSPEPERTDLDFIQRGSKYILCMECGETLNPSFFEYICLYDETDCLCEEICGKDLQTVLFELETEREISRADLSEIVIFIDEIAPDKTSFVLKGGYAISSGYAVPRLVMMSDLSEIEADQESENIDGILSVAFSVSIPAPAARHTVAFNFREIIAEYRDFPGLRLDFSKAWEGENKNFRFTETGTAGVYRLAKTAPLPSYKVSVIVPVYNVGKYLAEAVESVVSQTIGFHNIQLILVNDGSSDDGELICLRYREKYPRNIIYLKQGNAGVSAARNLGLDYVAGEYTCMLDGDDKYEKNFMEECIKFFNAHKNEVDFVAVPIQFFDAHTNIHWLSGRVKRTSVVDTEKDPEIFTLSSCSGMFSSKAIHNLRYDVNLSHGEDAAFVTELVLKKAKYGAVCETKYFYRSRFEGTSATQNSKQNVSFYSKISLMHERLFSRSLQLFGYIPKYVQHVVTYYLQWYGMKEIPEEIKASVDTAAMFRSLKRLLSNIEDDIIKHQKNLDYWAKAYMLKLKHGEPSLNETEEIPMFYFGDCPFERLGGSVWISISEETNGTIHFGGFYTLAEYESVRLAVKSGDIYYDCVERLSFHKKIYYLGEPIISSMAFDVYIPFEKNCMITFYFKTKSGRLIPAKLRYAPASRLSGESAGSFFIGDSAVIKRTPAFNALSAEKLSFNLLSFTLDSGEARFKGEAGTVKEYLDRYEEFSGRRIWLFMDRMEQAGDNAEALFRYCKDMDDGTEKYFVISEDSPDYERISKYGNAVPFGSPEHKLLLLFAEKFISSHTLEDYPVFADQNLLKSLVKCDKIFLQHGIIIHDLSEWLYRYNKNLSLFITSAVREYRAVIEGGYDYSPSVVKLTGMPRFDYLRNNPGKIILFMPTWRKSLRNPDKRYNPDFKNTDYFHCINDFLNDGRLIQSMRRYGFKLCFKPHPNVTTQICDFNVPDEVSVADSTATYNELYETGALLITDFSSAVFDFAYLKKPVLYYQKIPNHHEKGYFDYDTMGFGETVFEQDVLVGRIIGFMENGCVMPDIYRERADNFFAFSDGNNCGRVYGELTGMPAHMGVMDEYDEEIQG